MRSQDFEIRQCFNERIVIFVMNASNTQFFCGIYIAQIVVYKQTLLDGKIIP